MRSIFHLPCSQVAKSLLPPTQSEYACTEEYSRVFWHTVFTVPYVSSLKEWEQQPVRVWWTFRASREGHWNKRLLGSHCWPQWRVWRVIWRRSGQGLIDGRLLTPSPAGQVKPSNWDCSREAAVVNLQRPCHGAAECWWYKCYNSQGKMEQQGLWKGCLLQCSAKIPLLSPGCSFLVP